MKKPKPIKLTDENIRLLKRALESIIKSIMFYKDTIKKGKIVVGMCFLLDKTSSSENIKIFKAFKTTKPTDKMYGVFKNFWYPRYDIQSRINHLTKIKKEIEVVLKQGYY